MLRVGVGGFLFRRGPVDVLWADLAEGRELGFLQEEDVGAVLQVLDLGWH